MALTPSSLEDQIGQWRAYLRRRGAIHAADVAVLEAHLRDQVRVLTLAGLDDEEAFLVAVKRVGSTDPRAQAFAPAHSDRLWKQLVTGADGRAASAAVTRTEAIVVFALAVAAALAIKIPALFGFTFQDQHAPFYLRNGSFFALPFLTGYFVWKRRMTPRHWMWLTVPFVAGAVVVNVYPFVKGSETELLSALHLPITLWLVVGIAYVGGRWFAGEGRMDFVRFTGELAIYYALIALGGGVLTAFTMMMFKAIGLTPDWLAQDWIVPCGAMGAIIVGSGLVEAKQSVIENMAPVLTRLFTPLFTIVLLVFLATMAWTGRPIDIKREVLISFDLLLVVIVGLVIYSLSAREPDAPPNLFDALQLLLIVSALAVDVVALAAIASRISEWGLTPNKVSALGENIILLVNLAWSAWLYAGFLRGRTQFRALEAWQIAYLPVYASWATIVVVLFPPLFEYA
jgi:hypothetical protein